MKKQLTISLSIFLFLGIGTLLVVLYGKGYRFGLGNGKFELSGTGLLVTTSVPNGASVYIDGHLTTATDNTINLFPSLYTVRITKEGYFSWEKKLKIQKEVVAKADALLFPLAPKLESITASGVDKPAMDPSQTRIAYTVASQSARKNGIYVLDMSNRPILTLQSAATQIADDTADFFSHATLSWSPDGKEILASVPGNNGRTAYLLNASDFNTVPTDITATMTSTQNLWDKEKKEKEMSRLVSLKLSLQEMITKHFNVIAWSPDETKMLYQASISATLPIIIKPRLIGTDSAPEDRDIKEHALYVYDIKEDTNYKMPVSQPTKPEEFNMPVMWFPDSKHLIHVHEGKIDIMDYDGLNATTIYAGPFIDTYVFPWPNGSKIVILTNLNNSNITPNLYTISLK